ncbi:AAA family ATPase [Streptomyces griseoincarnatus]
MADPKAHHPDQELYRRLNRLDQHFRPAAPVDTNDLLKGRADQISRVLGAVGGIGEHAAIYGEPGVGKTSLSLVVQSILSVSKIATAVRVPCTSEDTFASIWEKYQEFLIRDIRRGRVTNPDQLLQTLEESDIRAGAPATPSNVFFLLDQLAEIQPITVFIDEFDRILDWEAKSNVSDLIKMLSDERVNATLVVVGVADDVEDLVAEHRSIERNLLQIPMPRLQAGELTGILKEGFEAADLNYDPAIAKDIVDISRGLPHYVHLMGRHIGRNALLAGGSTVTSEHWFDALIKSVEEAQETVARQYAQAISSHRQDALYAQVLLACALTPGDAWGAFLPSDISVAYSRIMKMPRKTADFFRHLRAFTEEERGKVLDTRGEGRGTRYYFSNPLLQPYVILRGLQSGLATRDDLPSLPA